MADDIYGGTYGFEPSPVQTGNSEYEDVATIARIGSAEMNLCSKFQTFHQEILENFYRLAGHIYSAEDLKKLVNEKRPNFEWNLFLPIILSIVGNFKSHVPSVDFYGEDSAEGMAGLQKKLSDYILFQANDIEYELAKAFLYAVVGRIGWLKSSYSYRNDSEGMILVEWYDSLRLKFDTNWRRRDTSDMRYMSDAGWYECSELIDIYAKKNVALRDEIYDKGILIVGESGMKRGKMRKMMQTWAERFLNDSLDYNGRKHGYDAFDTNNLAYNYQGTWYDSKGRFKAIDWYEKRQQPVMEITDLLTGKKEDITDQVKDGKKDPFAEKNWFDRDKLSEIRKRFTMPTITESWREVIWQTSVIPALNIKVYDAPQKIQTGQFKFSPVLCYDFHPDIMETKSVMDNIIDPVSSYNLRRNTILTYIMKMTQGGWVAEQSAVKGFEDELLNNEIVSLNIVADGALSGNKMLKKEPPVFPAALAQEAQMEKEDTQIISGQTPNSQGRKETARETGALFQQRIQQSSILQEWISDNAQSAIIMVARNNTALVQTYLTMPRVIMILGDEDNPEWMQINQRSLDRIVNDVTVGKYKIRIAKAPYGKKAAEMEFQKVMSINQWLATLDKSYVDPTIALKLSGLTVKNEMINHIKKVQQQIAQQAQEQQQAEQQQKQKADKEREEQMAMAKNHQKIQLLTALNGLHKSTLENRGLSDQISSNNIVKQLFGGSKAA